MYIRGAAFCGWKACKPKYLQAFWTSDPLLVFNLHMGYSRFLYSISPSKGHFERIPYSDICWAVWSAQWKHVLHIFLPQCRPTIVKKPKYSHRSVIQKWIKWDKTTWSIHILSNLDVFWSNLQIGSTFSLFFKWNQKIFHPRL